MLFIVLEIIFFAVIGFMAGLYLYLWLMYTLNLKSLEWNVVTLDLHLDGIIDDDQLRYMTNNPPWYVKFVRKFDVTERIAKWADEVLRVKRDKDDEDKDA